MKDLETMQREGREAVDIYIHHLLNDRNDNEKLLKHLVELDQHTANTWNEARESLLIDMKRTMKGWSGTGTAMINDYETLARDYD